MSQFINGIGDNSSNFLAGIRFNNEKIYGAATFSVNDDAFSRSVGQGTIAAPTNGYELSLGYRPNKRWSFEGGFNIIDAKDDVAIL